MCFVDIRSCHQSYLHTWKKRWKTAEGVQVGTVLPVLLHAPSRCSLGSFEPLVGHSQLAACSMLLWAVWGSGPCFPDLNIRVRSLSMRTLFSLCLALLPSERSPRSPPHLSPLQPASPPARLSRLEYRGVSCVRLRDLSRHVLDSRLS